MLPDRILVINPNSSSQVTRAIDSALAPMRSRPPFRVAWVDLPDAPPRVASPAHAAEVAPTCRRSIRRYPA